MGATQLKPKIDYNILFLLFLFMCISVFYIYEAQQLEQYGTNFAIRQFIFYIGVFLLVIGITYIDLDYVKKLHWFTYAFGVLLLVVLALLPASAEGPAITRNGATRWLAIPVIGAFQPAEITRLLLLISLAVVVSKHREGPSKMRSDLWLIGKMALLALPVVVLLSDQPDMGSIMMLAAMIVAVMLVSKISLKVIIPMIALPAAGILSFVYMYHNHLEFVERYVFRFMQPYQENRFHGWLNPTEFAQEGYGFQAELAIRAVGSGRLSGIEGTNDFYIPEAHSDFIFTIIGHTHGFIGACVVISLYFILLYAIVMVGFKSTSQFDLTVCAGIGGLFAFQVFQNIGMNVGLLPITGFSLPFISYGGTSLITSALAVGLVLSIKAHTKTYMFAKNYEEG
ncbi:FtsW/RodA/SpoVE family cell cycle protein [Shouchella shacheensis]|uniref:FtsW/RodA/SpoVE family cell cycle protein n=1 Tax=Shouchella shacheensis TaxID=1649580 RepID=UPI00073FF056|nr:FtsW/RodA/SpoVE family cell cycle protein [Shouchella shacheensis]